MENADLAAKKCVPCMSFIPPMKEDKARQLLAKLKDWQLIESATKIQKQFKFRDFGQAVGFVGRVARVAEEQAHHPDISISYNIVTLTLFTHKIGGLHENDFILAAKIDKSGA